MIGSAIAQYRALITFVPTVSLAIAYLRGISGSEEK